MSNKIKLYALSMAFTGIFIGLGVTGGILMLTGQFTEKGMLYSDFINLYTIISIVVGTPLMFLLISRYRKLERGTPSKLTKLYYGGRRPNQCKLCKKHPVSKNYHIKKEHELENVDVKNYFIDCGCDKCADYNRTELTDGFYKD